MFADEIRRAVQAAPRNDLLRLAEALWKGYAAGAVGEGAAQELSELIEARKAAAPAAKPAAGRRRGSRPRSGESMERRRRWCASGRMPPQIAARFTQAERAVLAVVAAETARHRDCRLSVGHLAALAGVCASTVRNALTAARLFGLISVEERRLSAFRNDTNVVTILSPEWKVWLRRGSGCKFVQPTPTLVYNSGETLLPRGAKPLPHHFGPVAADHRPQKETRRAVPAHHFHALQLPAMTDERRSAFRPQEFFRERNRKV